MSQLFVLGDSISIGYGPYLANYLPSRWQYARKRGIQGNTTFAADDNGGDSKCVLDYLQYHLDTQKDFQPDVLLLNCGLHDMRRNLDTDTAQVPIAEYEANLREIRQLVTSHALRIIWVTITPVDDEQHRQHESNFVRRNADVIAYAAVAAAIFANDPIIDLYTFTQQLAATSLEIYSDHVHFIEDVQRLQGVFISGALGQILLNYP